MTFHDFPWPSLFSMTLQAWKMVFLNSMTFHGHGAPWPQLMGCSLCLCTHSEATFVSYAGLLNHNLNCQETRWWRYLVLPASRGSKQRTCVEDGLVNPETDTIWRNKQCTWRLVFVTQCRTVTAQTTNDKHYTYTANTRTYIHTYVYERMNE